MQIDRLLKSMFDLNLFEVSGLQRRTQGYQGYTVSRLFAPARQVAALLMQLRMQGPTSDPLRQLQWMPIPLLAGAGLGQ